MKILWKEKSFSLMECVEAGFAINGLPCLVTCFSFICFLFLPFSLYSHVLVFLFQRKQGPIHHNPWPIQTVTNCQGSCRLSRQLQTDNKVVDCWDNCRQLHTVALCFRSIVALHSFRLKLCSIKCIVHCRHVHSCLVNESISDGLKGGAMTMACLSGKGHGKNVQ